MNDQPPRRFARRLEAKPSAPLQANGEAGTNVEPPEMAEINPKATRAARLERLKHAVAESEASGEAVPFDMDAWLEEQDRLDSAA